MGKHRTAWHLLASTFMDERRPSHVRIEPEVLLSKQPQRTDFLLLRKEEGPVDDARSFFRLWELMGSLALVEYKSRSRPPRPGVFHQLFGYGHQYMYGQGGRRPAPDLSLFLMVSDLTPTIHEDVARLGLALGPSDQTYVPVLGALFPTWIIRLNPLSDEEKEPLIGHLGSRTLAEEDRASWRWLAHIIMEKRDHIENLEDFEELREKFMKSEIFKEMLAEMSVRERLEGVSIRERLEGVSSEDVVEVLTPEQRHDVVAEMSINDVAQALTPEQRFGVLLTMSNDDLRQLPKSFVDTLPESVRAEIRRRLAH